MSIAIPPPGTSPTEFTQLTPISLFTGFLGSGKTTIISHLVQTLQNTGEKISYIKNEEGDLDLDAKLLGGQHIIARELLNGCVCCTLNGPFLSAIDEIISTFHPTRILVESSGTAEPANLATTISGHPGIFRDGIICIIDCLNFQGFSNINEYTQMQARLTDLIILNKLELINHPQKQQVIDRIRDLNPQTPILDAPNGQINPNFVFGINHQDLMPLTQSPGLTNTHQHHHLDSFIYQSEHILNKHQLALTIKSLPQNVIRIKGLVKTDTGLQVLNCVFHRCTWFTPPHETKENKTKLLLIGLKINQHKNQITQLLDSCQT